MSRLRAVRGLSLIEVIVALVVISGFGGALFVWAGQTLQMASRAMLVQQQVEIERNITELAFALNPASRPTGEQLTATHRYQWQSTLTRGPTDQLRHLSGVGPYQVSLYKVRFTVTDVDAPDTPLISERILAGYREVRPRQSGPMGIGETQPPR